MTKSYEYTATIDGGQGGSTTIEAEDIRDAMALAIQWAEFGDWPAEGCEVSIAVQREDDDGDVIEREVEKVRVAKQRKHQ